MWEIEYSQEASNYAIDSHPYNEQVLIAIEDLSETVDGLPPSNGKALRPNLYLWLIADHEVIYERFQYENLLYIWIVKPL